ncbi:hypothetical protein FBD94_20640 [Pedobacter hiemivivus]|uniref:Uncharacterized protein n=1 Tax=Pedobacter hiemivivus TaxID=2530454 RepID=A0A4U1G5D0_9SPHI|nr:hypothetical protein [Pedobacter hiemivivus]TKC57683.1 hypothetical protein FBD94_20640 [Pedobacter hiemivivus]
MLNRDTLALLRRQRLPSIIKLSETYKSLQPTRINEFAPRVGVYLIQTVYYGFLKPHTVKMAQVLWKQRLEDDFEGDFILEIQLESFERNQYPGSSRLLEEDLTNRTIHVKSAQRDLEGTGKFIVDWEILPVKSATIDDLNNLLQSGSNTVIDSMLESIDDVDLGDDLIDYGADNDVEY